jgi:hypothetical protein
MSFLLRPLIEELVEQVARSGDRAGGVAPSVVIDVDPAHVVDADPVVTRRTLRTLIEAAIDAAACSGLPSDGPPLHEVVITSVLRPDALDIEIADSGDASPHPLDLTLAAARMAVARIGGAVRMDGCPEGGRAVTVVLPRRAARRLAA